MRRQLPNLRRALDSGCDLDAAIPRAQKVADALPAFPERQAFAATLETLGMRP